MRALLFSIASFGLSIAFQLTLAKYGTEVPDWGLLVLWVLPLAPFGWWLWTHDKLLSRREKIKQYFHLHLWRSIGAATAILLIVAACLWGVGYTGWKMLKKAPQSASNHKKVTISDTSPAQKPSQSLDATRLVGTPPPEAPIDLAGEMEKIEARKLHIKEDTTAKDSTRKGSEKPQPLQTPKITTVAPTVPSISQNNSGGINIQQATTGKESPIINSPITIGDVPKRISPQDTAALSQFLLAAKNKARVRVDALQSSNSKPFADDFYNILQNGKWDAGEGVYESIGFGLPGHKFRGAVVSIKGPFIDPNEIVSTTDDDPLFYIGKALETLKVPCILRRDPNMVDGLINVQFEGLPD